MKNKWKGIFRIMALLMLALLVLPSILFLLGLFPLQKVHWIMMPATLGWFGFAYLWMGLNDRNSEVD